MSRTITTQGFMIVAIIGTVKDTEVFYPSRNLTKSMEREMLVKGTGSWCVLVENLKDNYYVRFHYYSSHLHRKRHISIYST